MTPSADRYATAMTIASTNANEISARSWASSVATRAPNELAPNFPVNRFITASALFCPSRMCAAASATLAASVMPPRNPVRDRNRN